MAEQGIAPVGAATGTFSKLDTAADMSSADGNVQPESGKNMPVAESKKLNLAALANVLNQASQSIGRDLRFRINMETGQSVIQVLDSETGELIREIPPEKAATYLTGDSLIALRLHDDHV